MYGGSSNAGADARKMEAERQARITQGMGAIDQQFKGFDDNFFNARADAYQDAAMPKLAREYGQTRNNVAFALARRGLGQSSAAVDKTASLSREMADQQRGVADAAVNQSNELRRQVEQQRGELTGQLLASADPATVGASAINRANMLQQPNPVARPLGNFFDDWSRNWLAYETNKAYNKPPPTNSWPMAFGGGSSQRLVGGP